MFGYVLFNPAGADESEKKRYRYYYCGLCKALEREHGRNAAKLLSYDLTFLYLLLSDLYNAREKEEREHCIMHPLTKRTFIDTSLSTYCADMQLLLSWYSARDKAEDDDSVKAAAFVRAFAETEKELEEKYPRQSSAVKENLSLLAAMEQDGIRDIEKPSRCFASALAAVFAPFEDNWKTRLEKIGSGMGHFIYVLDAYDDLDKDKAKGRYNPFSDRENDESLREDVRQELLTAASFATEALEELPLDDNLSILRNIVYSGIWSGFGEKKKTK